MNRVTAVIQELQKRIGSADFSKWQIHRWQFYDYVRYPAAGTTELTLFNNALGASDPTSTLQKTLEQTNMPKTGSFGQVYFFITQVRCHAFWLPKTRQPVGINDDADLLYTTWTDLGSTYLEILRKGVLKIQILQKDYFLIERPFMAAPPGFGLEMYDTASAQGSDVYWIQQNPYPGNCWNVTPMQMVEPENTLQCQIRWDTTSPALTGLVTEADPRLDVGIVRTDTLPVPPNEAELQSNMPPGMAHSRRRVEQLGGDYGLHRVYRVEVKRSFTGFAAGFGIVYRR